MKASNRLLNATSTGEAPTYQSDVEDLSWFDTLPPTLQRLVRENATKMSSAWTADQLRRASTVFGSRAEAIASVGRKTLNTERFEIAVFAGEYFAETGSKYPHTEAQASIQRYGDLGPSKHPPRRYGKPVLRPQRRRRRRWVNQTQG